MALDFNLHELIRVEQGARGTVTVRGIRGSAPIALTMPAGLESAA